MIAVTTDVEAKLIELVGVAGVVSAGERGAYAVDGIVPPVVALPETEEQVSALLTFANEAGLSVVPWGGGTGMSMGATPQRVDMVIGMSRLARILDYSPEDLTITAQAGVTLAQLQTTLAARGQMLPLDPALPDRATIGGVLATAASGPLRTQFGLARDLALGMHVVYPDGTLAKSGGRTVKNVAGYDMTRLHIGAFGTLGIIVEATFKVWPMPKSLVTVEGSFADMAAAVAGARALRMARIVPWSLVMTSPNALTGSAGYRVAVRLGGQPAVVDPQVQRAIDTLTAAKASAVARVEQAEQVFWPQARDWHAAVGSDNSLVLRIGVAPSHLGDVLSTVQSIAGRHSLVITTLAYPDAALVYCHVAQPGPSAVDAVTGMVAAVKEWNGNLTVERCPLNLKGRMPLWGAATADTISQRLKQTYDAKGILNPGRFVGGL